MLHQPPTDGSQTPGYPTYLKQFVTTIRDEELSLNVSSANALATTFMNAGWFVLCQYLFSPFTEEFIASFQAMEEQQSKSC